jgi:hypothetical protein
MRNFYKISFFQDFIYGVGVPENKENFDVPDEGVITDWEPIILKLEEGSFSDYQANSAACRLCSIKLKSIIEQHKSSQDEIQWLPMIVKDENGEEREYFILHFPVMYDVIDKEKSTFFGGNRLIKPVFSLKKIGEHKVFNYHSSNFFSFFISEDIKKAIEKTKCTNLNISKIKVE